MFVKTPNLNKTFILYTLYVLSAVDRGFEIKSGQTKTTKLCLREARSIQVRAKTDWLGIRIM
jgi:hypothetical protein